MTRVALYCRVSTSGQEKEQTIEQQVTALRAYCEQRGYTVADEFRDDGISGTVPFDERPEGSRLLREAKSFDRVVIYQPDRLSRDTIEGVIAYNQLRTAFGEGGCEFLSQSFDDTPEGKFTYTVFMAVAELERALIHRRMLRGKLAAAHNGSYVGGLAPYGYNYDADNKALTVNDIEAEVVRRIFAWYTLDGLSYAGIVDRLNSAGTPTRNNAAHGWTRTHLQRIITDSTYAGRGHYNR